MALRVKHGKTAELLLLQMAVVFLCQLLTTSQQTLFSVGMLLALHIQLLEVPH